MKVVYKHTKPQSFRDLEATASKLQNNDVDTVKHIELTLEEFNDCVAFLTENFADYYRPSYWHEFFSDASNGAFRLQGFKYIRER